MIVTAMASPNVSSSPTPIIILALCPLHLNMVINFPISSKVISLEPETMSNNTFLAPVILLSFSKGDLKPK
jgi:hypothetical protein